MTAVTTPHASGALFSRERLPILGVIALMTLLIIGIALFIILVLMPDIHRRSDNYTALNTAKGQLAALMQAKAAAPAKLQTQLTSAKEKLNKLAASFLNDAEATLVVNRLYSYAEAAGADIVNLQAAPPIVKETHSQRDYKFQIAGSVKSLLDFLRRIKEVEIPGFVVNNVSLVPTPGAINAQDKHLLTMNVSVLSSPYSTQTVLGLQQNVAKSAGIGNLPLAEVQRQVEIAWSGRDWDQAITLLQNVVEGAPNNGAARIALYRAHVNNGYRYLDQRNPDAAKSELETALSLIPNGQEASAELQQLATNSGLSHQVEDDLRRQLADAKTAGNWREVIRLLRIISVVDPGYGPVDDELSQAYINYGNQLSQDGNDVAAQEQYQLAQYIATGQSPAAGAGVTGTQTLSDTAAAALAAPSAPASLLQPTTMPVPPTATPLPSPTPLPTLTPTQSPAPTATPSATATQPPPPTATPLPTATFTPPPTATSVPTSVPTLTPTATPSLTPPNSTTALPFATASPSFLTQPQPQTATYVVQQGDTLFSIARRFGTTVESLRIANGLVGDTIHAGQILFITPASQQPTQPGYIEHIVAPRDTLYSLAQRYGTTVEAIMQANGLGNSSIYIGQRLLIPTPVSAQPLAPSIKEIEPPEITKISVA